MIRLLVNTFATKVATAAITLGIVILTTRVLGTEGRGTVSLISADIGIILLFIQIIGGPSLVFLVPRFNTFHLLICSVVWSLFMPLFLILGLHFLGIVEQGFNLYLTVICMIQGISSACQIMLLGHERINIYNLLMFTQTLIHFLGLGFLFFVLGKNDTESFMWSLMFCNLITMLIGLYLNYKLFNNFSLFNFWITAREAFKRGFIVQFSNIIQFLNYRLSFFFLSPFLSHLGLFSISLVLAEAVWLLGNSISLVQYSKISNEKNREESVKISFNMAKISFWATLASVIMLLILPEFIYSFVFGKEFGGARYPTMALCPGILAIGVGMSFSHHFAGIGKFKINNIAAIIGLAVKIPCCLLLVSKYKEIGAAIACSLSYIASCVFLFIMFKKETGFKLYNLLISKSEMSEVIKLLKGYKNYLGTVQYK